MSDDKYKKPIENTVNNTKPTLPQQGDYCKDSYDNGKPIKDNSIQFPTQPSLEKKSFGLMSVQSSLDEINKK